MSLGIPLGDIYVLFNQFEVKTTVEEKRQKLQELVKGVKNDRATKKKPLKSTVTVHLKWYNYNPKLQRYTMVRIEKGGGCRSKQMEKNSSFSVLEKTLKDVFFPDGINSHKQLLGQFHVHVGDSKLEKVSETLKENGEDIAFTMEKYNNANSIKKYVFILMTKELSSHLFVMNYYKSLQRNEGFFFIFIFFFTFFVVVIFKK